MPRTYYLADYIGELLRTGVLHPKATATEIVAEVLADVYRITQ